MLAGVGASLVYSAEKTQETVAPAHVELKQADGHWALFVNQKPFFVKGAGLEFGDQEKLAAAGGNSFRTWRTENGQESGRKVLDHAFKNGLYVTMGLEVSRERHGFNYSDPVAVAKQLAEIKGQVMALKDHPALLAWDIGNELNLNSTNPMVWNAVNDISKMIHQVDTNHPTTTSLAGIGKSVVAEIKNRAPDLDFLCFQSYADIVNLPRQLQDCGWNGPYMVTEWGATGHWECGKTAWGAPIEDNSTVKARLYRRRYEIAIGSDKTNCLGSYVFLWGQKQERTPTWYGMFLASGESTATVDSLQEIWTGQKPATLSPEIEGLWLDGKTAQQSVHVNAGQSYAVKIAAHSPSASTLKYVCNIMEESGAQSTGGDFETQPQVIPGLVTPGEPGEAKVKAPSKPGAYRLFAYVIDANGKAGYANLPFYVGAKTAAVAAQE